MLDELRHWWDTIRPTVPPKTQLGKAWLFADTPAGAHAGAVIYSLVETARANGPEPHLWLRHVSRRLPNATTAEHFEALLPWNCPPADLITT